MVARKRVSEFLNLESQLGDIVGAFLLLHFRASIDTPWKLDIRRHSTHAVDYSPRQQLPDSSSCFHNGSAMKGLL